MLVLPKTLTYCFAQRYLRFLRFLKCIHVSHLHLLMQSLRISLGLYLHHLWRLHSWNHQVEPCLHISPLLHAGMYCILHKRYHGVVRKRYSLRIKEQLRVLGFREVRIEDKHSQLYDSCMHFLTHDKTEVVVAVTHPCASNNPFTIS